VKQNIVLRLFLFQFYFRYNHGITHIILLACSAFLYRERTYEWSVLVGVPLYARFGFDIELASTYAIVALALPHTHASHSFHLRGDPTILAQSWES